MPRHRKRQLRPIDCVPKNFWFLRECIVQWREGALRVEDDVFYLYDDEVEQLRMLGDRFELLPAGHPLNKATNPPNACRLIRRT